jgi:predicted aspartyl protease
MGCKLFTIGLLAAVWAVPQQPLRDAGKTAVRFKLLNDYVIVLKGSIGPLKGLNFLLDTGAVPSVIDQRIAKKIRLTGRKDSLSLFTRKVDARSLIVPEIRVGPVTAKSVAVLSQDLSALEKRLGTRVDAMIGLDVLQPKSFRIDYESRELSFNLPAVPESSCPMQTRPGFAYVTILVHGKPMALVIDTGAKNLVLFSSRIKGRLSKFLRSGKKTVYNMGGKLTLRRILLDGVILGGESPRDLDGFVLDNSGQADPGFDGLLGVRALGATEITFDFERSRIAWR